MRPWLAVGLSALVALTGGCFEESDPVGDDGGEADAASGSATAAAGGSSRGDAETSATTGGLDGGEGSTAAGSSAAADGSSTDATGEPGDPYGMCSDDRDCVGQAPGECNVGMTCAPPCDTNDQCPPGGSGDALPVCGVGRCQLACAGMATCPDGMNCVGIVGGQLCTWAG